MKYILKYVQVVEGGRWTSVRLREMNGWEEIFR